MKYNADVSELDNMFVHLTNVSIQKHGVSSSSFQLSYEASFFFYNQLKYKRQKYNYCADHGEHGH